jgi:uncharacterized protein (DUF362 family)
MNHPCMNRRNFIKSSVVTGVGVAAGLRAATYGGVAQATGITAQVSLVKGLDRADNAFRACAMFKKQIAAAIGNKRVVIKPNFVSAGTPLACTDALFTEGVLEFLKSIGNLDVVVAEAGASGTQMNGYEQRGYWYLTKKYPVKLMDMNEEGFAEVLIWQYGNSTNANYTMEKKIRVCKMLMNPNNFVISAAPMKTHNTVVATLSTKNIAMGAPVIDIGSSIGSYIGSKADKTSMHGPGSYPSDSTKTTSDYQVTNDNIYRLVKQYGIRPSLAVIDGFVGMQGQGPVSGVAVTTPQHIALASLDHLAADRVGLELMRSPDAGDSRASVYSLLGSTGMPFPACLNYLGQAGAGEWNLANIEVLGETIAANQTYYTPHTYHTEGWELAGIRETPRPFSV